VATLVTWFQNLVGPLQACSRLDWRAPKGTLVHTSDATMLSLPRYRSNQSSSRSDVPRVWSIRSMMFTHFCVLVGQSVS